MQSRYWKVRLACGLTLLTLAGCYSNYPYGGGGYPGYSAPPAGFGPQNEVGPGFGPGFAPGTVPQLAPQTFSQRSEEHTSELQSH